MANHAISRLTRAYAVLLGKYEFIEREIEHVNGIDNMLDEIVRIDREKAKMMVEMDHISAAAKHLDPKWQRERVPPIYPRKKAKKYGIIATEVYAVLRAAKAPLRTREISKLVAPKVGIALNERELTRLDQAVYGVLTPKIGRVVIKAEENPAKWILVPRDKVRSDAASRPPKRPPRDKFPPLPRNYSRSKKSNQQ